MDKVYTRVSDQNGAYIPLQGGGGGAQTDPILFKKGGPPRGGGGGEGPI